MQQDPKGSVCPDLLHASNYLLDYPEPRWFRHKKTYVLASRWDENRVRYFFVARKYGSKTRELVVRCRTIPVKAFDRNFQYAPAMDHRNPTTVIPETVRLHNPELRMLCEQRQCSSCGKLKYTCEFHRHTTSTEKGIKCVACKIRDVDMDVDHPGNMIGIDRSSKSGFMSYMYNNPHYFRFVFDVEPTPENITKAFREILN